MPALNYTSVVNAVTTIYETMEKLNQSFSDVNKELTEQRKEQAELRAFITTSMDDMRAMLEANSAANGPNNAGIPFSSDMSFSIPHTGDTYVNPLYPSLGGRDWFKPGKGISYKDQVKLFLLRVHPDWMEVAGEPLKDRVDKNIKLRHEFFLLKTYAKAATLEMKKELYLDPRYNSEWRWGECGNTLQAKYYDLLERIASAGSIPISRCVGHWMAQALMSMATQHRLGPKKVTPPKKKRKTNKDSDEDSDEALTMDDSHVDDMGSILLG